MFLVCFVVVFFFLKNQKKKYFFFEKIFNFFFLRNSFGVPKELRVVFTYASVSVKMTNIFFVIFFQKSYFSASAEKKNILLPIFFFKKIVVNRGKSTCVLDCLFTSKLARIFFFSAIYTLVKRPFFGLFC